MNSTLVNGNNTHQTYLNDLFTNQWMAIFRTIREILESHIRSTIINILFEYLTR